MGINLVCDECDEQRDRVRLCKAPISPAGGCIPDVSQGLRHSPGGPLPQSSFDVEPGSRLLIAIAACKLQV